MAGKGTPTNARAVRPYRMPGDPVVPDTAPCVQCGGERSQVAVRHGDPFCCTVCCKAWYGVAERVDERLAAPA